MTTTTTTTDGPAPASDPGAVRGALVPLLFGFFPTQVLHVAATLQLADHLHDAPRTTADLAAATGTDEPSLARVLRALACFGVVDEAEPGTWALGPHGPGLLTEGPVSLRHLVLLFAGDEVWRSWGELGETVRTGEPAWDRITGASSFEHMRRNPEFQAMFNRAMAEGTRNAAPGIAEAGGFDRFRSVVDVGGGDGTLLAAVLRAHAHLRGTVFDLAEGMETAPQVLAAAGVSDRGDAEAGDFFAAVPGGHDAYLVKSVIHDWDDERAGTILRNIRCRHGPRRRPARGRARHARRTVVLARRADDGDERPEHARVHGRQGTHRERVPRPARGRRVRRPGHHPRVGPDELQRDRGGCDLGLTVACDPGSGPVRPGRRRPRPRGGRAPTEAGRRAGA